MAGRKRSAPNSSGRRVSARLSERRRGGGQDGVPDVVREMLAETNACDMAERPLKRKIPGERFVRSQSAVAAEVGAEASQPDENAREDQVSAPKMQAAHDDSDEEAGLEFEDVFTLPAPRIQTITRDSDDEDDEEDLDLEDVNIQDETFREITLNLSAQRALMSTNRSRRSRKAVVSKADKGRRIEVHKVHLLCLLAHVARRNHWCNDSVVQDSLRPLLSDKTVANLHPSARLNQFGRSEALRNGVQAARTLFKTRFAVTERGMRRALWVEDEGQLKDFQLPNDQESTLDKVDFLSAAKSLSGSRDVGAQLFCALLRSVGVEARLVCSLQPLGCAPNAPTVPRKRTSPAKTPAERAQVRAEANRAALAVYEKHVAPQPPPPQSGAPSPVRRRLGHPGAAGYYIPLPGPPPLQPAEVERRVERPDRITGESAFPVYWVEVLDEAYQKWQPVDPLVTNTQWRPRDLEPPALDRENCLSYVMGFEEDGSARDVTRRYAKAYNAKTRKLRVDGLLSANRPIDHGTSFFEKSCYAPLTGARWWRRVLRLYKRPHRTDVDEIEATELHALVVKEAMPRNVADFKDHPVYALERHLRRHEALIPGAKASGTVIATGSKGPLEKIYRRADVRIARSRQRWYREGRVVRPGEEPVKVLPPKRSRKRVRLDDNDDDDDDDPNKMDLLGDQGTPLFTYEQTGAYEPPPVVNGRVPKNKFGNLDVFVPSMIPSGGAHIVHERAAQAVFILGVDYAPALTGFKFKGRQGTAVLTGIVVPTESEEGVRAVIGGLEAMDEEMEAERRARAAVWMWGRLLRGLRIRERIWAGVEEAGGEKNGAEVKVVDNKDADAKSDRTEECDVAHDGEGGGFLVD